MDKRKNSYFMLVVTMILWGGSWPITHELVRVAPPFTIGFFRFFIASLLFLPALYMYNGNLKMGYSRDNFFWFFLLGLLGGFGYGIFFFIGLSHTTAAQGAIIAGVNPAFISIFAHIFHKERLAKKWMYTGFFISITGVFFVIGVQAFINYNREHLIGNLLIVCAMLCWGMYSNVGKHVMKKHSSLQATAGGALIGMILFGIAAITEKIWTLEILRNVKNFWLPVIYLASMATFLGFWLYFRAIKIIGATNSSIFINLVPIFGTFLSWLFLGETIYWTFIIGLILIITGITIINYPNEKIMKDNIIFTAN